MQLDGLQSRVMPPPTVTLTFDLLIPKSNQHIYEAKYILDQNGLKFSSLIFEMVTKFSRRTDSLADKYIRKLNGSSTEA